MEQRTIRKENPNGRCIAVTGGIACGKSTVASFWRNWGVEILDADRVAHELIDVGGAKTTDVLSAFGADMALPSGGIDRNKLATLVFTDSNAREKLNQLLHPAVKQQVWGWATAIRQNGKQGAALIPLLFEVGMDETWDAIVCVASPEAQVLSRLQDRGCTLAEAHARIASQMSLVDKMKKSNYTIMNDGSLAELENRSREVWNQIFEQGVVL